MYEDKKNKYNLFTLILRIIIALLVLVISIKLISIIVSNNGNKKTNNYINDNLLKMSESANKYVEANGSPSSVGETVKITLSELVDKGYIGKLSDGNNNTCDLNKSYIKITLLDQKYQVKSYITCSNITDYKVSFIEMENKEEETTTTTTKKTKKNKTTTTKKVERTTTTKNKTTKQTTKQTTTTEIKKNEISFNTNGGELINTIKVIPDTVVSLPTPTRKGYKFVGWYYHNEKVGMEIKADKSYVLVAKWKED